MKSSRRLHVTKHCTGERHLLKCQSFFLAVAPHAVHDQQYDMGRTPSLTTVSLGLRNVGDPADGTGESAGTRQGT